jgi:pimeloyl-ACP methyl ester carboxylesterase
MESLTLLPAAVPLAHQVIGAGSPLVLITGTGYPGATWSARMLDALAEQHTVVVFDHRGTGDTPGTSDEYSTRLLAADTLGLIDTLGLGPAHVLGHSMGGRVAQWMAIDAPDRVRSLVLAASGPGQFRADQSVTRGIPVRHALGLIEKGYEGYMRAQIPATFFTPELVQSDPDTVTTLIDSYWEHRPTVEEYLKHIVARQCHQTAELLDRIAMRTLVLVGSHDTHVGGTGSHVDQSYFLAETLPNAEFSLIEGAAHGYFWSHPDESTAVVLDFLRRYP